MNTRVNSSLTLVSNANKVLDVMPQPQGLCTRLAYGTANCMKRFGLGIAVAGIYTPTLNGASYLAGRVGLIFDQASLIKEQIAKQSAYVIDNLEGLGLKIDSDALINAPCHLEELVKQINSHIPLQEDHISVFAVKAEQVKTICICAPIFEELLFRGLIQDVLLTKIPKFVIRRVAPGKEAVLDTKIAKVSRIILTAALFSTFHLTNSEFFSDSFVSMQMVAAFVTGIGLGILKESKAGLLGAMGGHIANNMIAFAPALWNC